MSKRKVLNKEMIADAYNERRTYPGMTIDEFGNHMNDRWNQEFSESAWRKAIQQGEKAQVALAPDEIVLQRELRLKKIVDDKKYLTKIANTKLNELAQKDLMDELTRQLLAPYKATELTKVTPISNETEYPVYIISDMQEDGTDFSKDVFAKVTSEILSDIAANNYKQVYILENGDGIDGILRVSDLYNNPGGYVDQLVLYEQNLADLLKSVSKQCYVQFSIVNSNHTEIRPFGAQRGQVKREDITYLIFKFLQITLRKENIHFLNNDVQSALDLNHNIINIAGFKVFQHHGDMKYANSNQPINTFNKIRDQYGPDIDIAILAHYHHTTLLKHVSKTLGRKGDKQILFVPALDPRQKKQNEIELGVASEPSFTKLIIKPDEGIAAVQFLRTGVYK